MFAIEYWCGPKYGGWFLGKERFPSEAEANARIIANLQAERRGDITPLYCRPRAL